MKNELSEVIFLKPMFLMGGKGIGYAVEEVMTIALFSLKMGIVDRKKKKNFTSHCLQLFFPSLKWLGT